MAGVLQALMRATFATISGEPFHGHRELYEKNRRRILAVAYWMTDSELVSETLLRRTFTRALTTCDAPSADSLDRALIEELRDIAPVGALTLHCTPAPHRLGIRHNTLREHLERAVMQVPATERMIFILHDMEGYSHGRIAGLLDLTVPECQVGLYQARLRIRELVAAMEHAQLAAAC